jgi:regulatory protein
LKEGSVKEKKVRTALVVATDMILRRPRTEYQVRLALKKKGYEAEEIDSAVEELIQAEYVDDGDYAVRYLEVLSSKRYGRRRVVDEMRRRGLAFDLAMATVENHYTAEEEMDNAMAVAEKALRDTPDDAGNREISRRISLKLTAKGFDYEIINRVIPRFLHDK